MLIRPIRTQDDYQDALKRVTPFFENPPIECSEDADLFEILLVLIENYEAKHYSIGTPSPVDAIKFRMEQAGLTPKDLEPMIGRVNRVYEVLAGRRRLTLPMIRRLHKGLGIPLGALIAEPG